MRFSVVIPVYNVEQYLKECLDSVVNQAFVDWEAICVDDGSVDNSNAILAEYVSRDCRIKAITQPNGGLSAARNTGMRAAQGDYVLFLDSDDWLETDALEVLSKRMCGEDMLCFSGRRYHEETRTFNPADKLCEKTYESGMDYYNENALLPRDFAFVCAVLRAYKRTFLLDNSLWFKEGIFHEDNLFTPLACYYAKQVCVVDACLYNYRIRANSITTTADFKRLKDLMGIANELAAFFIPKQDFDKTVVYRAITHHYQVAFLEADREEKKEFRELCDWRRYRKVSRTKLRHRWNYFKYHETVKTFV